MHPYMHSLKTSRINICIFI